MNASKSCFSLLVWFALVMTIFGAPERTLAAGTATTTTLTLTSGSSAVSSVNTGSVLTLTAGVQAGSTAVTSGQVNFCDAAYPYCTDIHLLGTAQLSSAGTAVLKFVPGVGNHSYKAVFAGTPAYATSTSSDSLLTVTGNFPATTVISQKRGGG